MTIELKPFPARNKSAALQHPGFRESIPSFRHPSFALPCGANPQRRRGRFLIRGFCTSVGEAPAFVCGLFGSLELPETIVVAG